MTLKEKEPRPPKTLIQVQRNGISSGFGFGNGFSPLIICAHAKKTGTTQAKRSLPEIFYQARVVRAFQMPLAPFGAR